MRGATWDPRTCWSIWWFIEANEPETVKGGGREWANWREGFINDQRPKRAAKCVACGGKLTPDMDTLYAHDCASGPGGGWTPTARYIHAQPCIGAAEAIEVARRHRDTMREEAERFGITSGYNVRRAEREIEWLEAQRGTP